MSENVPPGPFRFLDLPVDIRLMVYEEYFVPKIKHHAIYTLYGRLPMPEIVTYNTCYLADDEVEYLFDMIRGLVRIFDARPIDDVKFSDVVDGVRESWRIDQWIFLSYTGGDAAALSWAAEVVHRMVTRRTRGLPLKVSWFGALLAWHTDRDALFV